MSTPQQPPLKVPRRSTRRQQQNQTPETAEPAVSLSESEAASQMSHTHSVAQGTPQMDGQRNKKKLQIWKKTQDGVISDSGQNQSSAPPQEKVRATPIKQAYAGPTFHASPAPSTLPLPSFYSQSVPNVSTIKPPDAANDSGADPVAAIGEPGKTIDQEGETNKRESTPLDWMFEAARQSKGTSRAESPSARSTNLSAYGDSPHNRSPAPREGDVVFPFELEGSDTDSGHVGESFATPYKERLEALRPASAAGALPSLDERERHAKSEALKKLLMHSQPPRSASASPHKPDTENPFNARAPQVRNLNPPQPQFRYRSGASTPNLFYGQQSPANPPQYFPVLPPAGNNTLNFQSPMNRPPSSQLRNVYQPSAESSPVELSSDSTPLLPLISTARKQPAQHQTPRQNRYDASSAQPAQDQVSRHKSKPSAQQLEDDLKRFLKIDLTSRG